MTDPLFKQLVLTADDLCLESVAAASAVTILHLYGDMLSEERRVSIMKRLKICLENLSSKANEAVCRIPLAIDD